MEPHLHPVYPRGNEYETTLQKSENFTSISNSVLGNATYFCLNGESDLLGTEHTLDKLTFSRYLLSFSTFIWFYGELYEKPYKWVDG